MENPDVIRFEGTLERFPDGLGYHSIRFPHDVETLFGTRGSVRVLGTFNGLAFDRALIPAGDGTHYLIVPTDQRRQLRLAVGSRIVVELWRNKNPEEVPLPEEWDVALDLEPGAREAFERLSRGTRRQVAYWIDSAKRPETRAQRAAEMLRRLLSGRFYIGGKPVE